MPEVEIKSPEDIKKLVGWTIKDIKMVPGAPNAPPHFAIFMSHPAASKNIVCVFMGSVSFQIDGVIIRAMPGVSIQVLDE